MLGKNSIVLNLASIKEAVEQYLNSQLADNFKIEVADVTFKKESNYETFEITIQSNEDK